MPGDCHLYYACTLYYYYINQHTSYLHFPHRPQARSQKISSKGVKNCWPLYHYFILNLGRWSAFGQGKFRVGLAYSVTTLLVTCLTDRLDESNILYYYVTTYTVYLYSIHHCIVIFVSPNIVPAPILKSYTPV